MLLAVATALASASATHALGAGGAGDPTAASKKLETGKRLYRKYCGQCHALRAARAAGFGSGKGLGRNGGPSFNNLRVPYNLSILLMTQPSNGHEHVSFKLTWTQVKQVSAFVATVTKHHDVLAQPTDG